MVFSASEKLIYVLFSISASIEAIHRLARVSLEKVLVMGELSSSRDLDTSVLYILATD